MSINWFKVIGVVSTICLVAFIGYGAYRFYFGKPVPQNHYYTVQAGGTINQNPPKKEKNWAIGGFIGTDKTVGVTISRLF